MAAEFTDHYPDYNTVQSVVGRMMATFGDDAELEIEVRRHVESAVSAESRHPTQAAMPAMVAEDASELHRLVTWLGENRPETRLAGENLVDWTIRLLNEAQ